MIKGKFGRVSLMSILPVGPLSLQLGGLYEDGKIRWDSTPAKHWLFQTCRFLMLTLHKFREGITSIPASQQAVVSSWVNYEGIRGVRRLFRCHSCFFSLALGIHKGTWSVLSLIRFYLIISAFGSPSSMEAWSLCPYEATGTWCLCFWFLFWTPTDA